MLFGFCGTGGLSAFFLRGLPVSRERERDLEGHSV